MKNKKYPLLTTEHIADLREMMQLKANACPDQVAFRYMANRKTMVEITYGQFYSDVRALGTYLLKHHTTGRKIAIISENNYHWLVAFFAIVTTGNIAVLVAKDATPAEAAQLVYQSGAHILLGSKKCAKTIQHCKEKFGRRKIYASFEDITHWMRNGQKALDRGRKYYEQFKIDPDKNAAIFFTSGSTGFSKGVMINQTNMVSNVVGCLTIVDPKQSTMSVLPYTHAFGLVVGLMVPFHAGMSNFICSNLANFMREIPIAKPTTLCIVPLFVETFHKTIWRSAEKSGEAVKLRRGMAASDAMLKIGIDRRRQLFESIHKKFGGNLELIICGGAPLDPNFVKEFRSLGIQIINGYGITECAPVIAANRNYHFNDKSVGQILPNVEVRIEEPDSNGIGEITVCGPNVMEGYYGDPAATEQVLENGWFRTGDLGYVDKDNFLYVTGRKKSLIILSNGENVSPEEIEQYVDRIDEVGEVVVYAEDSAITAEVYPDQDTGLDKEELLSRIRKKIDALNASLPNYKHIAKLKFRDSEFEKTTTRKIKRYKTGQDAQKTDAPAEGNEE